MYDLVLSFVTAFGLSYVAIPYIIRISKKRQLFDKQNDRTSHIGSIPTLGGLAIFAGLVFSIILWTPIDYFGELKYLLGALIVLFLVGLKDDIDPISPITKFISQLIASGILVFWANIRITTLYSIFGVGELPYWLSVVISILVIIALINAFNLIDGIDGLAASISILSALVFGYWFYLAGRIELAVVSFALVGSLFAFFRFNVSPARIFMGDAGSMIIGLIAAVLSIEFIEHNKLITTSEIYFSAAPAMAIAVLIIPVYDTLRIITLRLAKGRSPFKPDKNHIHHQLLRLGLNHSYSTLILLCTNIIFILFAYQFRYLGNVKLALILLIASIALSGIADLIVLNRGKTSRL